MKKWVYQKNERHGGLDPQSPDSVKRGVIFFDTPSLFNNPIIRELL